MSAVSRSISTAPPPQPDAENRPRRRRPAPALAALAILIAAAGGPVSCKDAEEDLGAIETARVQRGPMLVSVTEDGEVKADRQKVISNELDWSAIITEVAPQGKQLKPGDTIIRFECEELMNALTEQELRTREAEDQLLAASKKVVITRKQMEAKVRKAGNNVVDAQNDLKKYMGENWWDQFCRRVPQLSPEACTTSPMDKGDSAGLAVTADPSPTSTRPTGSSPLTDPSFIAELLTDLAEFEGGEWRQQQQKALSDIQLAQRDLKLAEHKLESKLRINEDPELNQPYSQNEIEADKLRVERLRISLQKAKSDKNILLTYTHPRKLRDLVGTIEDALLNLETSTVDADTQIRLAEADKASAQLRLSKRRERLKELQEDEERLHITATEPGLVVYETRRRHWQQQITVAVGEEIRRRQQLMIIPDLTSLQVETQVYEAVRDQVREGLPAHIRLTRLDAREGEPLSGRVTKVAPLPDQQNPWLSPGVKVFPTVVSFEDSDRIDGLTPGMTATVEIVLARLQDALSVPIAAVFSEQDGTYCFKMTENGPEKVPVGVGRSSETRVEIVSGLAEEDVVLLSPPPGYQVAPPPPPEQEEPPAGEPRPDGNEEEEDPTDDPRPEEGQARRNRPTSEPARS
jgi:multidrug efflux pump subunit AcrA (membrane-fusion protein)